MANDCATIAVTVNNSSSIHGIQRPPVIVSVRKDQASVPLPTVVSQSKEELITSKAATSEPDSALAATTPTAASRQEESPSWQHATKLPEDPLEQKIPKRQRPSHACELAKAAAAIPLEISPAAAPPGGDCHTKNSQTMDPDATNKNIRARKRKAKD